MNQPSGDVSVMRQSQRKASCTTAGTERRCSTCSGSRFAFGLTVLIRWLMHEHPVIDGDAITIVALIAVPLFFLVGLGAFDYWFYWAAGRPTRPEDHSSHGAHSWRDYFRVNTDHKVIGIQYVGHLVLLPARRAACWRC